MKQASIKCVCGALVVAFLFAASCSHEPDLTPVEKITETLIAAKAWEQPTVTIDGVDFSSVYKDFSITFKEKTFVSSHGLPIWPPSGSWEFIDDTGTRMLLDNGMEVGLSFPQDETMELSVAWSKETFEPGRLKSIKGQAKFTLKKQ